MHNLLSPCKESLKRLWPIIIGLLTTLLLMSKATGAQGTPSSPVLRAQQATVFLMQTYNMRGVQIISCVGSGTLISPTGLILTNAHLADTFGPCRGEKIIVALSVRTDAPPIPTYLAEVAQLDVQFDLAILQIAGGLDGSLIDPQELSLPWVPISERALEVLPGNTLTLVGYPNAGTTSVTAIEIPVTGITSEKSGSRVAWLRINASAGGGLSGGGAYTTNGQLVGVPTSTPATLGSEPGPNCLSLQDDTKDGLIDERDTCVPIGGDVTAIRSISFAVPLIEAAHNGFRLGHTIGLPTVEPLAPPMIGRTFFSPQVNEYGIPTKIVTALPSETTSLFLFFDYDNMRLGTPYELRVTKDGLDMPQFSLGPLAWGGGQRGTWFIGTENITWPDGNYQFTLLLSGQIVVSSEITIGGAPMEATFSELVFGTPANGDRLQTTGSLIPAGITQVDAHFNFEGLQEGQDWTEVWYLDGTEIFRMTRLWDRETNGQATVSAINYEGLPLGTYRLELFIGQRLAAAGEVILAGHRNPQGESAAFSNPRIASEITRGGLPAGQLGETMPLGITSLYLFIDWDLLPNGLPWTYRWFLDGRLVASSTQPWNAGGVGQNFWLSLNSKNPLPEGTYAVEVLIQNRPMFSANASIGSGTQPISGSGETSDEAMITGVVIDALTGRGIPGAMIFILDVKFESPDFRWDEAQIHTQATTDQMGHFAFPEGLPRGNYYTVYVLAEGYITIVEDNFTVLMDQTSPATIVIEMNRP